MVQTFHYVEYLNLNTSDKLMTRANKTVPEHLSSIVDAAGFFGGGGSSLSFRISNCVFLL